MRGGQVLVGNGGASPLRIQKTNRHGASTSGRPNLGSKSMTTGHQCPSLPWGGAWHRSLPTIDCYAERRNGTATCTASSCHRIRASVAGCPRTNLLLIVFVAPAFVGFMGVGLRLGFHYGTIHRLSECQSGIPRLELAPNTESVSNLVIAT